MRRDSLCALCQLPCSDPDKAREYQIMPDKDPESCHDDCYEFFQGQRPPLEERAKYIEAQRKLEEEENEAGMEQEVSLETD